MDRVSLGGLVEAIDTDLQANLSSTQARRIIGLEDYRRFAGPDWPSYERLLDGDHGRDPSIQQEVREFIRMMQENYHAQTRHGDDLALANQQRQKQIFFDKKYHGNACQVPWQTLGINANGDVFICLSPSWIPKFVGNLLECDDIFQLLNSQTAMSIRQEILGGRYTYCNNHLCSFFAAIPPANYQSSGQEIAVPPVQHDHALLVDRIPRNIILDFDYTCNFRCPSCRVEVINNNRHHVIRSTNDAIAAGIRHLIIDRIGHHQVNIRWCGGEPFISDVYLDLLDYIASKNQPNIRHTIQTNGSYLQKKADLVMKLLPMIDDMRVSFDAATANTYHQVRVNGQWDQLLSNVRWLRQCINDYAPRCQLIADFVVQLANYKEIPEFVLLCRELGIDKINWQKMWNWGTWDQQEFDRQNIYRPDHPSYVDLVQKFQQANQPMSLI